jgi:hypothetical protein
MVPDEHWEWIGDLPEMVQTQGEATHELNALTLVFDSHR